MIELPAWAVPNAATPALVDAGGVMRSPLNTAALRINRLGSHYMVALAFPPYEPEQGRIIVSRLIRAQVAGLRVPYPLFVDQGQPAAPVVDGAGQAGLSLKLRGLTPGYVAREGYWLSIVDPAGQHYLHNVAADAVAAADGGMTIALSEMLRVPFQNGAAVHLAEPMIEGIVDGDKRAWTLAVDHTTSIEFTIEEAR
ncbi:hypothetical protein [uncultured Sphingomonas sp.]|uniref:hypothetical protein n=1 Tax=uncultured Sphingomonas sp. TaxID=158754 RepID=UPI0025E0A7A6|nr:hypothetical protein [uncultured Sphingomonas sp.]